MQTLSRFRAQSCLLVLILALGSCESITELASGCGERLTASRNSIGEQELWTFQSDQGRTFAWISLTVPSVCVSLHSELEWHFTSHAVIETTAQGEVVYGIKSKTIPLSKEIVSGLQTFEGTHSRGIRDFFDEDEVGSFRMSLDVGFPTSGNLEDDKAYFFEVMGPSALPTANYNLPKN